MSTTLYRPGLLGLGLLHDALDGNRRTSALAVIVRIHREGGLPQAVTPTRIASILDDADQWLLDQAELGADPSAAELQAAVGALNGSPAPKAADVFQAPSPS